MTRQKVLTAPNIRELRALDTCTVSNAIEQLGVRLRNEGFMGGSVRCRFPKLSPLVGYAATARIRTASPPMRERCYHDRMDWWAYVASIPEPRVIVLEDADPHPGVGAFVGRIHAAIARGLNCVGCVTDGAARDLPAISGLDFQVYSGSLSVSHAYAHITEFGTPVEVGGLTIRSRDLLHGDRHGVLTIPLEIASDVPAEAQKVLRKQRELMDYCASPKFTLIGLGEWVERERTEDDCP